MSVRVGIGCPWPHEIGQNVRSPDEYIIIPKGIDEHRAGRKKGCPPWSEMLRSRTHPDRPATGVVPGRNALPVRTRASPRGSGSCSMSGGASPRTARPPHGNDRPRGSHGPAACDPGDPAVHSGDLEKNPPHESWDGFLIRRRTAPSQSIGFLDSTVSPVWEAYQAARLAMSSSVSVAVIPSMMGFGRTPERY